jgi:hypothetical protein
MKMGEGKVFVGESGSAPILGAKFWHKGEKLSGRVIRKFDTKNGPCTVINLDKEAVIDGLTLNPPQQGAVSTSMISIGNMKGFESAVLLSGCGSLENGDHIDVECTGEQDTGQASPMVNFKVKVQRR